MTAPSAILADATRRQRQAAAPGASVWVDASAGTGKTKVLVDRVLALLLDGAAPEKLLCLTYTRAAAAEMANRINDRLAKWATAPEPELREALAELSGAEPARERIGLARRLFARALDAPGGLKIMTIHAFCQSLIARFPLEAGIAPHFELMDERSASEALASAREAVLARARAEPDGTLAKAVGIVAGWAHEDRAQDVLAQLARERGRLKRLFDTLGLDGLVARQRERLGLDADETAASVIDAACADGAFDHVGLKRCIAALLDGQKTDVARGNIIAAWFADPAARADGFAEYAKAYLTKEDTIRARLATKGIDATFGDILRIEAERVLAAIERCKKIAVAEASAALVTFAAALIDAYERNKADDAALDYDDLVLAARALLARDGGASWVLYKLDGGVDHILIDEAQDTSPAQWAVVAALAEEFFAGEGASEAVRTVFAVGDAKQSIFSFQGADVAAFAAMRAHFRERVEAAERHFLPIPLDISFRSTDAVLAAVDAVFARADARDGLGDLDVRHRAAREGQAGLVELWPAIAREKEDEPAPWTLPLEVRGEDAPDLRLARAIAARIARWIADGEILESQARPIRAGDVMVLVGRRTGFVDALVRELKRLSVPVAGIDRMVLTDQAAVEDLIALGHFLLLPEDDLTLAEVLKGPLYGIDDERLFRLAHGRPGTLWAELQRRAGDDPALARAHEELSALLARADFVAPFELYAELLGPRGGRARILARLGRDARDPLDEFLSLALAYEAAHPPALQGFLHWLAAGEAEIKRDLEHGLRDEVRILTVHGAKGLQAPIVFLPDTMAGPRPGNAVLWLGDEGGPDDVPLWAPRSEVEDPVCRRARDAAAEAAARERHRLLYVAMTRAEDRLYVCGHRGVNKPPAGCWYELVEAALPGIAQPVEIDLTELSPAGWRGPGFRLATAQRAKPERLGAERAAQPAPQRTRPDWARGAPPAEPAPRPLSPSRPEGDEPPVAPPLAAGSDAGFRRGILIHRLLEALPDIAPEARREAAESFLARPAHRLDAAAQAEIADEVLAVLADARFARVFDPAARAEVAVSGMVAGRLVAGQVDRLAVTADEVLVVDYKSNRPPPQGAAETPVLYLRQMAAYRAVLARIWRDRPVRCAILWTAGPALIPLPDAMLDRFAPDGLGP